jgi:hypothetical protein
VSPFVEDQTFVLARLDVQQLPFAQLQQRVVKILRELIDDPDFHRSVDAGAQQLAALREAYLQAGGRDVYMIISLSDFYPQPAEQPFFIVTSSSPDKLPELKQWVAQFASGVRPKLELRQAGDTRLLIGTEKKLNRVEGLNAKPRPEVVMAFQSATKAPLQLVLAPSEEHRRVVRETLPQFPRPWENVTGQTISEGVQWAALSINGVPNIRAELLVESKDEEAAQQLRKMFSTSLQQLAEVPALKEMLPNAKQLFASIKPTQSGNRVRIKLTEDQQTVEAILKPLAASITAARASAKRMQSTNNLKQIALAMHVYHEKNKHFPAPASYDANGKPLLSWRVHLLPYLDQKALYDQFKLDEPWDSEHNKRLAMTIPRQFVDPRYAPQPGKTTYLLPIGKGTVFGQPDGMSLRQIRDGSANTLMVVSATPDNAVLWTKPVDLNVTEADPKKGLVDEHHDYFLGALCDGSVRVFVKSIDPKTLQLLLGANDGQPVEWDKLR